MRRIEASKPFLKTLNRLSKKNSELRSTFKDTLEKLIEDPFTPSLKTHKLKGRLKDFFACTISFDLRLVFKIEKDAIVLIDVGSHDEVY